MKPISQLIILIISIPFCAWGQSDTTYYFGVNGKICDIKNPQVKKEITYNSKEDITVETSNFKDNKWNLVITEEIKITDENEYKIQIKSPRFTGKAIRTFEKSGENNYTFIDRIKKKIIRTGEVSRRIPLIFDGQVIEFYKNGKKKSISVYENNQLVSNENWLKNGDPYINNVFYSVDQEPLYKMGMSIIHSKLRNAFINSKFDISQLNGRIIVGFVVMEDGTIDGIRIEEGLKEELNKIALETFHDFRIGWQPAKLNGIFVRYYQLFPINFINEEKKFEFIELYGREISLGN